MTERKATALELAMEVNPKEQITRLLPRVTVYTVCEVSSEEDFAALWETLRFLPCGPNKCYVIPILELE